MPGQTPISEGQYAGDWLKWEEDNLYSREEITILAGSGSARELTSGMVLGKITASGKYVQLDPDAVNGAQNAAGILLLDATAPDGTDKKATAVVRDAIVNTNELTWPTDSDLDQAAAEAQLEALGILCREGN